MHSIQSAPAIRPLTRGDLDAALDLSSEAGWNQVRTDWERLIDLAPDGCFGCWHDGELVATCTVISYGSKLCWIGMMLVRGSHRRRGFGRAMFEKALETSGSAVVGLDATEYGRPLYEQYGFEDVAPVTRWRGRVGVRYTGHARSDRVSLDSILDLDSKLTLIDRGALLRRLARDGKVIVTDGGDSYAFLRPGRSAWQLGPVVATGADPLVELLTIASIYTGEDEVVVDAVGPASRAPDTRVVLTTGGLKPDRLLLRMTTRPTALYFAHSHVIGAAGLELG